jgi:hypothetical protein
MEYDVKKIIKKIADGSALTDREKKILWNDIEWRKERKHIQMWECNDKE